MNNITVIAVSFFSSKHINRLRKNLLEKANQPENLSFLIVDNTNGKDIEIEKIAKAYQNINLISSDGLNRQRSISHSTALDKGLKNSKTTFTLIIDPDVYIFKNNWDIIFKNELNRGDKRILGAPYPQWKIGKVHDFPSVVFLFFKTKDIQNFKTSFYPFPRNITRLKNSIIRKCIRFGIFGNKNFLNNYLILRRVAKKLEQWTGITSPDTGNKIMQVLRKNNFIPLCFKAKYSRDIKNNNTISILAREYEAFYMNNELIMTHMYGSGVFYWKTRKGSDINYWLSLINQIEKNINGYDEKK
jgi:hypothetical protein